MAKKVFTNTTLACSLQDGSVIANNKCLHGLLSPTTDGFRFEEEVRTAKPHTRNPKIFDGELISLVRKEDNSIQFSFKTTKEDFNPEDFAFKVYQEVSNAILRIQP